MEIKSNREVGIGIRISLGKGALRTSSWPVGVGSVRITDKVERSARRLLEPIKQLTRPIFHGWASPPTALTRLSVDFSSCWLDWALYIPDRLLLFFCPFETLTLTLIFTCDKFEGAAPGRGSSLALYAVSMYWFDSAPRPLRGGCAHVPALVALYRTIRRRIALLCNLILQPSNLSQRPGGGAPCS